MSNQPSVFLFYNAIDLVSIVNFTMDTSRFRKLPWRTKKAIFMAQMKIPTINAFVRHLKPTQNVTLIRDTKGLKLDTFVLITLFFFYI